MFTGIVEELGELVAIVPLEGAARLTIHGPQVTSELTPGASIAVNGVCLTVVDNQAGAFTADVMAETLHRSSLGSLVPTDQVNLERPVRAQDRLGGHIVQGHVDAVGEILAREPAAHWTNLRVSLPESLNRYVVEKGSITVDGISLTVVAVDDRSFLVSLIPTTLASTTLGSKPVGALVNLEVDIVAKYVEKLITGQRQHGLAAVAREDSV